MAERIALLYPFCSQIGEIACALCIWKDRLGDEGDPVFCRLFDALFGRLRHMFNTDIGDSVRCPALFPAGTVYHA